MGILLAHSGHGISGKRSCGAGRDAGASGVPAVEHAEDQPDSEGAKPDAAGGGSAAALEIGLGRRGSFEARYRVRTIDCNRLLYSACSPEPRISFNKVRSEMTVSLRSKQKATTGAS